MQHEKVVAHTSRKIKVHEKNYPNHDLELVFVAFSMKYGDIICMLSILMCIPTTRVFNMFLLKKS